MSEGGRIVILGAGPTGLGAGWRLKELGHADWDIYEAEPEPGGLSASFTDTAGFTWDLGGHVHFSHYPYYDEAAAAALGQDGFNTHVRNSFIHILDRFVRYPFQNHLGELPPGEALRCLAGIFRANLRRKKDPADFREWLDAVFGRGVVDIFMEPYNRKVWGHPLEKMSYSWIGERVSVVGIRDALGSIARRRGGRGWGPNFYFRYPREGGTGLLFQRMAGMLGRRLKTGKRAVSVDPGNRMVAFEDGSETGYDSLVSTIPVDRLVTNIRGAPGSVRDAAGGLVKSGCIVVGVGVRGGPPPKRHWIYFPEERYPFYRVTYLSNYSSAVVPDESGPYYSFLCEIPLPKQEAGISGHIEDMAVEGLLRAGMLPGEDAGNVVTVSKKTLPYAYPVPTLDRDVRLKAVHQYLEPLKILSRGRFGGFRYEAGNMDHSFMQGVQAVERLLLGKKEAMYKG